MEQIITINCPEGKKAIYDESTQTIKFVDPKSKSWEEFYRRHPEVTGEYFISPAGNITNCCGGRGPNNLASKEDAEGILALIQLTRLHDEWVESWKPESSSKKYQIVSDGISIFVRGHHNEHRILEFPTSEMTAEFLDCFRDLIEKAKKFI